MSPWLVTRAVEEATALVERLERTGVAAAVLPCIERTAIEWSADLEPWSGREVIFMVTSPFGARRLIAEWPRLAGRGRIAAVEPTTAAVLKRAGLQVDFAATGGALALARALVGRSAVPAPVIVWLTSAAGLTEPEQLEASLVLREVTELHRIVAYETRSPPALGAELQRWHGVQASAVFFSPSACRNFLAARTATGAEPVLERIACVGQSSLRAWSQLQPRDAPAAVYQADEESFVGWASALR